jgi:hypothetical protein
MTADPRLIPCGLVDVITHLGGRVSRVGLDDRRAAPSLVGTPDVALVPPRQTPQAPECAPLNIVEPGL